MGHLTSTQRFLTGSTANDRPGQFTWRHRRQPYDLVVYQLGNSRAHDFMWSFLFRYPGLLVLHDAQVHQARALWLLAGWSRD